MKCLNIVAKIALLYISVTFFSLIGNNFFKIELEHIGLVCIIYTLTLIQQAPHRKLKKKINRSKYFCQQAMFNIIFTRSLRGFRIQYLNENTLSKASTLHQNRTYIDLLMGVLWNFSLDRTT